MVIPATLPFTGSERLRSKAAISSVIKPSKSTNIAAIGLAPLWPVPPHPPAPSPPAQSGKW